MNMKLLWSVGVILYLVLLILDIKELYELSQLEKKIKNSEQDKPLYEIWLEQLIKK